MMAVPAAALAETLDELPLDRGYYVRTDESCPGATAAGTAVLRRAGLQWVTSQCIFEKIEQTGPTTYRIQQSCGDAAHRESATADWEIVGRAAFSFRDSNGWEHAARRCVQKSMPNPWRTSNIAELTQ